jgi:hypothetical protein
MSLNSLLFSEMVKFAFPPTVAPALKNKNGITITNTGGIGITNHKIQVPQNKERLPCIDALLDLLFFI